MAGMGEGQKSKRVKQPSRFALLFAVVVGEFFRKVSSSLHPAGVYLVKNTSQ